MLCPTCNTPVLSRVHAAVGSSVLFCQRCNTYSVPGSSQWVKPGEGMIGQLRQMAERVKEDQERYKHFMEAPIDGPLWESVG